MRPQASAAMPGAARRPQEGTTRWWQRGREDSAPPSGSAMRQRPFAGRVPTEDVGTLNLSRYPATSSRGGGTSMTSRQPPGTKPVGRPQEGPKPMTMCMECGSDRPGRVGPADSEYAGVFFCNSCWESWEVEEQTREDSEPEEVEEELLTPSEAEVVALLGTHSAEDGAEGESEFQELSEKVGSAERAKAIVQELRRFSRGGIAQLKLELRKHGFPPRFVPDSSGEKRALLARLKDVLVWKQQPVERLRRVCEARHVQSADKDSHEDLLEALSAAAWEARGIPLRQLPSQTVAIGMLEQFETLERRSIGELTKITQSRCADSPIEGEVVSKTTMLRFLRQLIIWDNMLPECLDTLCREHNITAADKKERMRALLKGVGEQFLQKQQCLVKRISDKKAAREVLDEVRRLEDLSLKDLRYEYRHLWGLPVEPGMGKEGILDRIKTQLVWHSLPTADLRNDCQSLGVTVEGRGKGNAEADREALIHSLTTELCISKWKALGIPADVLETVEACAIVVEQWDKLERLSNAGLRRECTRLGLELPSEGLEPEDLKKCLQSTTVWLQLPVNKLRASCAAARIPHETIHTHQSETDQSHQLISLLLRRLILSFAYEARGVPLQRLDSTEAADRLLIEYQKLDKLDYDTLMRKYQKFGLPQTSVSTPDLLARVKDILLWQELSAVELKKECQKRSISAGKAGRPEKPFQGVSKLGQPPVENDDRQELFDRLVLNFCERIYHLKGIPAHQLGSIRACDRLKERLEQLEKMSLENIISEHKAVGLPLPDDARRKSYIDDLKQHTVWMEMPLGELKRLCTEGGVYAATFTMLGDEDVRKELVGRLVSAKQTKHYEDHGVPVRRLELDVAARLLEHFLVLEKADANSIREECLACGLPEPPSSLTQAEVMKRLKWALALEELPFVELRKECVQAGVKGFHSAPEDCKPLMLRRMRATAWESGEKPQEQRKVVTSVYPDAGKHFRTLELPASAGLDDVKKAYKKLALKHHPDKHLGEDRESTSAMFLEISAAYEGLLKHFAVHA